MLFRSAAGICYGAALGGGRVLNATSAQGLLYALEQLPVQAGTRVPMVLNIAARSVSGPLDIRGDHSDIYYALNTGWIILCARDPQAVYDLNFAAVKIGEHRDVRVLLGGRGAESDGGVEDRVGHGVEDRSVARRVLRGAGLGWCGDRKSTRLNSSHMSESRMPSSA